jgi:potassium voltage-gated channel Shaw-related subfamily C protein
LFSDTQDVLLGLDRLDLDHEPITEEEIPHKFGWDFDPTIRHKNMTLQEYMVTLPWFKRLQPRVWQLFEEPYSSSAAKVKSLFLRKIILINPCSIRLFKLFQSFLSLFQLYHFV